jgi:hypothetical protein
MADSQSTPRGALYSSRAPCTASVLYLNKAKKTDYTENDESFHKHLLASVSRKCVISQILIIDANFLR